MPGPQRTWLPASPAFSGSPPTPIAYGQQVSSSGAYPAVGAQVYAAGYRLGSQSSPRTLLTQRSMLTQPPVQPPAQLQAQFALNAHPGAPVALMKGMWPSGDAGYGAASPAQPLGAAPQHVQEPPPSRQVVYTPQVITQQPAPFAPTASSGSSAASLSVPISQSGAPQRASSVPAGTSQQRTSSVSASPKRRMISFGHRESIEFTGTVKRRPVRSSIEEEAIQNSSMPSARKLAGPKHVMYIEALKQQSAARRQSITLEESARSLGRPPSQAMPAKLGRR
uniref:Uncharacterized protein n=1 Tax=Alexandrium monilatum TaxID=311494 RepID=A0A7S4VKZ2_9DINO|mmetsp:Transcript_97188/g.290351  ORF Transcript_97188/g.290351 Transcript_97188/m.290351 type:complete len:280 (-) Transcript_97188:39-878(-)